MWTCKAIYDDRLRDKMEEPVNPVLLLCLAFMLASLSSFLSLLTFYPKAGQAACSEYNLIKLEREVSA